ncbi:MAG: hypothetical protein J7647_03845 [Cyanobacteria bacterium SBLK]|nr:hypothetical protein [Cyanobacteria bacterium SBLK]
MTHSWYLGIDFSASGIAAVLYDRQQNRSHPLSWLRSPSMSANLENEAESPIFRLPVDGGDNPTFPIAIAPFPTYFHGAIPCYNRQSRQWEPQFGSAKDRNVVSLRQLQQALQGLLETLNPEGQTSYLASTTELSEHSLKAALQSLEGIVLSCSALWSDTYRFNLREAILEAKLVETPDRIFFLEEAIALSITSHQRCPEAVERSRNELAEGSPVTSYPSSLPTSDFNSSQQGILILQGGTTTTELALVENLPLEALKREDWVLRGLEYGAKDLYCDIFCQLLYSQWLPEQKFLQNLKLEIPQPGEPDRPKRDRATLKIENFSEGQSLLETAKRTLLILQKQEAFSTYLGQQEWGVTRTALVEKILQPFYTQLNRQINELLSQKGWYPGAIARVFCSGEMLTLILPLIRSWLCGKFPEAEIALRPHNPNHFPIAEGLCRLPLFPQMLDRLHHQYGDYFLLAELLRAIGDAPLTLEEIVKSLERRGIPRACLWRVLPFLSGHLPEGFIPSASVRVRMTAKSREFLPYPAIAAAPLLNSQPPLYFPNTLQKKRLQQYLAFLLAKSVQKLQDPLAIEFAAGLKSHNELAIDNK